LIILSFSNRRRSLQTHPYRTSCLSALLPSFAFEKTRTRRRGK
jgi:hypothetical protein